MSNKIRIGALVSGGGTNLQAIIDSCNSGKINGEIIFVGSDKPEAKGLERAAGQNIPTFVVDYESIIQTCRDSPGELPLPDDADLDALCRKQSLFSSETDPQRIEAFMVTRVIAEHQLLEKMNAYPFDLLILAGFMRTLTPYFIDHINTDPAKPRIMNIHPAILPAFPGTDGYGDTFRYGCKVGGCTVHFIDYGKDSGPIIGQKVFDIEPDDTLDRIKAKGLQLEWKLYPECVQLFADNRLTVEETSYVRSDRKTIRKKIVRIH